MIAFQWKWTLNPEKPEQNEAIEPNLERFLDFSERYFASVAVTSQHERPLASRRAAFPSSHLKERLHVRRDSEYNRGKPDHAKTPKPANVSDSISARTYPSIFPVNPDGCGDLGRRRTYCA